VKNYITLKPGECPSRPKMQRLSKTPEGQGIGEITAI
jgi:hypothetical protein